MYEYYFLFALALLWTIFATFQDLKYREVSNWLNFSLIAIALSYRAFYSISTNNINFFLLGLSGFAVFFVLANIFYYSKAFAGGDAKLLMGFGIILPFQNYSSLFTLSLTFLLIFFTIGAIYSLLYTTIIISKNLPLFKKSFKAQYQKNKLLVLIGIILSPLSLFSISIDPIFAIVLFLVILLFPLLWIYVKSIDQCMVVLLPPSKLSEGDWLIDDIKLKNTIIKKTVHGLSLKDISLLKKANKNVLIKEGIPFVPTFLLSLIFILLFFLISKVPLEQLFLSFLP